MNNFAEIDAVIDETLDRHEANPSISLKYDRIVGFMVPDENNREVQVQCRRDGIWKFRDNRKKLIADMATHGLTPLAVIPAKAWYSICDQSRLYRFWPDYDGNVAIEDRDAKIFAMAAVGASLLLWGSPAIYALIQTNWSHGFDTPWGIWATLAMLHFAVSFLFACKPYIWIHKQLAKLFARVYDFAPRDWVLRRLFPDGKGLDYVSHAAVSRIVLPTPPDDVATVLRLANRHYPLQVAVVPEGFQLQDRPSAIYAKQFEKNATERADRIHAAIVDFIADPIIYTECNGMVAVMAQFGDFPIERAAVEQALEHEDYLL